MSHCCCCCCFCCLLCCCCCRLYCFRFWRHHSNNTLSPLKIRFCFSHKRQSLYPIFNPLIIQPVNWHRGGRLVYINNPMARGIIQVNNPHLSFESACLLLFLHYAPLHFYFILFSFYFFTSPAHSNHTNTRWHFRLLCFRGHLYCVLCFALCFLPHTHTSARDVHKPADVVVLCFCCCCYGICHTKEIGFRLLFYYYYYYATEALSSGCNINTCFLFRYL